MSPEEKAFWDEVEALTVKNTKPVVFEYRWHYNDLGEIISCSMDGHPESTQYVVVDKDLYEMYFQYKIVKGKPVKIDHDTGYRVNLVKHTQGYQVVKDHAGLLLEDDETYNQTEYYAYRNN
jgi:hypothetical protein